MFFKKIYSTVSYVSCEIIVRSKVWSRFRALFIYMCGGVGKIASWMELHTCIRRHIMFNYDITIWMVTTLESVN